MALVSTELIADEVDPSAGFALSEACRRVFPDKEPITAGGLLGLVGGDESEGRRIQFIDALELLLGNGQGRGLGQLGAGPGFRQDVLVALDLALAVEVDAILLGSVGERQRAAHETNAPARHGDVVAGQFLEGGLAGSLPDEGALVVGFGVGEGLDFPVGAQRDPVDRECGSGLGDGFGFALGDARHVGLCSIHREAPGRQRDEAGGEQQAERGGAGDVDHWRRSGQRRRCGGGRFHPGNPALVAQVVRQFLPGAGAKPTEPYPGQRRQAEPAENDSVETRAGAPVDEERQAQEDQIVEEVGEDTGQQSETQIQQGESERREKQFHHARPARRGGVGGMHPAEDQGL